MSKFSGPLPLNDTHEISNFDCGKEPLNRFLKHFALANQANGSTRTFVGLDENRVVGYYSLTVSSIIYDEAPERMAKGLAKHPIPVLLMARFAVDKSCQGMGIGSGMFKDALKRCLTVSQNAGIRAFIVHAKDEEARHYYLRFRMAECPSNPMHLYLLMKDLRQLLNQ